MLLVCVLVVAGRRDASGRDGSSMTDEEVVKWMEDNPERLDEIMEELTADMREENQLAGHARQVALIQAAKTGNLDDVKFALREGCKLADRSDKNETALHLTAVWGHPHVCMAVRECACSPPLGRYSPFFLNSAFTRSGCSARDARAEMYLGCEGV